MIEKLVLCSLLVLALGTSNTAQTEEIKRLRQVHTIYVDKLGDSDGAHMIRERIINQLIRSKRLTVVDDAANADAILTGAAEATEKLVLSNGSGGTRHTSAVAARVITKEKRVLWVADVKSGKWKWSDRADEKIVKQLLEAIKKDEKESPGP